MQWRYFLTEYILIANIVAFAMMGLDKSRAVNNRSHKRIPEAELFLPILMGGAVGGWVGMLFFRHKIRKPRFAFGIPLIAVLEIVALVIIFSFAA